MTVERTQTRTSEENQNGQPAATITPKAATPAKPAPAVPIAYKDGEEVVTTETETTIRKTTIPGVVASGESQAPKLSADQVAEMSRRTHKRGSRLRLLEEWLEYWDTYEEEKDYEEVARFMMIVIRVPDPLGIPGHPSPYRVACSEIRSFGEYRFTTKLNDFIRHIQSLENSGGIYRVELKDADGDRVKSWGYYTAHREFVSTEANYYWEGSIPNPQGVQGQQRQQEQKKEKSRLDLLREMAEERKLQIELGIIKDDTGNDSLLSQLQSGVIPAFLGSVITTSTEVAKKALEASGGQDNVDRGAWGTLVHGVASNKELTDTLAQGVINGGGAVFNLLGDLFLEMRRDKQREREEKLRWERVEKWQAAHPNAPVPPELLDKPAESQPQGEDLLDVIMRLCESKTPGNFNHPEIQAAFNNASLLERGAIKGALMNRTAEEVLNQFISLAEKRGKGERALKLKTLPQTIPFIKDMQRSLGKEVE